MIYYYDPQNYYDCWRIVAECKNSVGTRELAEKWRLRLVGKSKHPLDMADTVLRLNFLRAVFLMLWTIVSLGAVWYLVAHGYADHIIALGVAGLLTVWCLIYALLREHDQSRGFASDFVNLRDKVISDSFLSLKEFSRLSYQVIQKKTDQRLVELAYRIRKLEDKNRGVPDELWMSEKISLVRQMKSLYDLAHKFGLVGWEGYGPYYKRVDEQLKRRGKIDA